MNRKSSIAAVLGVLVLISTPSSVPRLGGADDPHRRNDFPAGAGTPPVTGRTIPETPPGPGGVLAHPAVLPAAKPLPAAERKRERVAARTATTKVYELADGRLQAEIGTRPVHYRDAAGRWQDIVSGVRASGDRDYPFVADGNAFSVRFGSATDRLVSYRFGERGVSLGLEGASGPVTPAADGGTVTFRSVLGGADLGYDVTADAAKSKIVLHRPPTAGASFTFVLKLDGVEAAQTPDGAVAFSAVGATGPPLFYLPKPFMYDDRDDAGSPYGKAWSGKVSQSLTRTGDRTTLTITADESWLRDPARRYPVVVDPTIKIQPTTTQSQDAMIISDTATTNYDGSWRLSVGATGVGVARSMLKFDLSQIPAGTQLDSAQLQTYYDQTHTSDAFDVTVEARRITAPWTENTVTWSSINTAFAEPGQNLEQIDNPDAGKTSASGTWASVGSTAAIGGGHRTNGDATTGDTFTWVPRVTETGSYEVQVHYVPGTDRATNAPYTVHHAGTSPATVAVNQTAGSGNGTWKSIGTWNFNAGTTHRIVLGDVASKVVVADAVRLVKRGVDTKRVNQSNVWHTFSVRSTVQDWLDGRQPNHGFMLKATDETLGRGGPRYEAAEFAYNGETEQTPKLLLTYGRPGPALHAPATIRATGADLTWSPYVDPSTGTGDDIIEYQVHRSIWQNFQPSAATLIAPLGDTVLGYTDTSATPTAADSPEPFGNAFYYIVAAKTRDGTLVPSQTQLVRLPKSGRVVKVLQNAVDTTLSSTEATTGHDVLAGNPWVMAGNNSGTYGTTRVLVKFPNLGIPSGARVLDAEVNLWGFFTAGSGASYEMRPLTRDFDEAGASWSRASATTAWTTAGGDTEAPVPGTITVTNDPAWRGFEATALAQRWVTDAATNRGVMVKLVNETSPAERTLFLSGEGAEPQLRPKLTVVYTEPTTVNTYYAPTTPGRMIPGDLYTVPVTLTNTTTATWPASTFELSYRWELPDGTDKTNAGNQRATALPADLAPGAAVTLNAAVMTPLRSDEGNKREAFVLKWDLRNRLTGQWLSQTAGIPPLAQPVSVEDPTSDQLGLEKFYQYTGENAGAGSTVMVNQFSGNAVFGYNAFSNPGRGLSTFFRITYNSQDTSDSYVGYGWSLSASSIIRLGSPIQFRGNNEWPQQVDLTDGDGTSHVFELNKHGSTDPALWDYDKPAGVHLHLQRTRSGDENREWVMTRPDRTQFYFDRYGYQSAIVDKNGNTMAFTYERKQGSGRNVGVLKHITDPAARQTLTLTYYQRGDAYEYFPGDSDTKVSATNLTSGQIVDKLRSVTDVNGRRIDFIYSDKGVLRQLIDGAGTTKQKVFGFFYDTTIGAPRARLLRISDPRNNSTRIAYFDTNAGPLLRLRARQVTDRTNQPTTFNYTDPDGNTGSQIGSTVTDANNHTSTYLIDGFGRTTLMTNAKGERTELTWDEDNNVRRLAEDNGAETTWVYDPNTGYPLEIRDPEANRNGTAPMRLGYRTGLGGHVAELTSKTSPEGRRWEFGYDAFGNLTSVTDPKGTSTSLPGDYATTYTYDTFGQLLTETDANENVTRYSAYDPVGYPTKITDALTFTETYTYDRLGNVVSIVDARQKRSDFTYDLFGRPETTKIPKDQAAGVFITTPAPLYDPNDNVVRETAPNGAVMEAGYDASDRTQFILEPRDTATSPERRTTYAYDPVGNLIRETEPKGTLTPSIPDDFTTVIAYDELNRVLQVTDAGGGRVTTTYDRVGNVITVADQVKSATPDPADFTVKYGYDLNHRTITATDAGGHTTRTEYDRDNNVVGQVDQENNRTIYVYDQRSALVAEKVPHKQTAGVITYHTTEFEYDEFGSQTKVVSPRGVNTTDDPDDFASVTVYDPLNRVKEEHRPYDRDDTRYTTPDKFTYAYDEVGNLSETTAPPSQGETTRLSTRYTHFDNGWIRTSTEPWNIRTEYDYDNVGSQILRKLIGAGGATRQMNWTYFPDSKKKTQSDDGGGSGTARKLFEYTYDPNANLTQMLDKSTDAKIDEYLIRYDGLNRVDRVEEKLAGALKNTTTLEYRANDMLSKRTHDRQHAEYTYDVRDLVSTVKIGKTATDPDAKTTRFTYTPRGQKDVQTKHNGNTVDYDYYLDRLLQHQVEKKSGGGTVVNEHTLEYDANSQRSKDIAHKQNADNKSSYLDTTTTYAYDPRDRVRTVTKTGHGAGTESYVHDANDNVIEQTLKGVRTTFNYDRNRLVSSVAAGVTSTYEYDAYGRLTRVVAAGTELERYVYDGFDRTVSHTTSAGGTTTYRYDPLDRQISRTRAGKTTELVYLGLTENVLAEEEGGRVRKTYLYGPDGELLSQINTKEDGTEEDSYHGHNPHSDVEQLTDEQGDARATYGYTAYGKNDDQQFTGVDKPDPANPEDPNAEPYNVYRFNGKRWDQATGDYDMGFRDYDPGLNRFLARDNYNGALADLSLQTDPFTQNRYAFAGGNPVTNVEIDGHFSLSDIGHAALDVAGLVPGVGEVADLANAAWYAAEGDMANAALSAASAIPFAGYAASAAKGAKYAAKGADALSGAAKASDAAKAPKAVDAGQSAGKAAPAPRKPSTGGSGPTPTAKAADSGGSSGPARSAGSGSTPRTPGGGSRAAGGPPGERVLFGQARIGAEFSPTGRVPQLRGRNIADVAEDLRAGRLSPDVFNITAWREGSELVAENNRGLATLSLAGMRPQLGRNLRIVPRSQIRGDVLDRLNETSVLGDRLPSTRVAVTRSQRDHTLVAPYQVNIP